MPARMRIDTLQAGYMNQSVMDKFVQLLADLGYGAPIERSTDAQGTLRAVFQPFAGDGTAKANCVLDLQLYSYSYFPMAWYGGYNPATKQTKDPGASGGQYFNTPSQPTSFVLLDKPGELGMLLFKTGAQIGLIGHLIPQTKPVWWDDLKHPYLLSLVSADIRNARLFAYAGNPWNEGAVSFLGTTPSNGAVLQHENPLSRARDVMARLNYSTQYAFIGVSSADLAVAARSNTLSLDTFVVQAGVEEYVLIDDNNPGTLVRVV